MSEHQSRLTFALDAARESSELILRFYQQSDLEIELKEDQSPVTVADRGAEQLLRDRIGESFPDDGILGEEFGEKESRNGFRWILDPIDGTKSFVHGVPLFGTLMGLEQDGRLVLGVCRFPALDEVVYATEGEGAWWQVGTREPQRVHVSKVNQLEDAMFCFTTVSGFEKHGRKEAFDRLVATTRLSRGWGDCYGHILVATGRADVMVDPVMNPWDAAALLPIIQEAGGHYIGWNGDPSIYTGDGISVNSALRHLVLEHVGIP